MWGGRFEGDADPLFRAFNDSLPVDRRLAHDDIIGSIAWAQAIRDAGVLTAAECDRLTAALRELDDYVRDNPGVFDDAADEDIHGWVERELIARVGDLGKKLHTGRSRNDQVATDFRLWTRRAIDARIEELRDLARVLIDLGEREFGTIIPGYTHLQRAMPVLFAHWCLAYVEMFERDIERLHDARRRVNRCPLGSAALAGTSFPIDREMLAKRLGFDGPTRNSLDGVSDRDFAIETLAALSLCSLHLSRLAEDLIIYSTAEFGFVEMSDAVTSGSSLMPQKKNPDAMELIRGKCGRIVGALTGLMMTVKGTSLAYNKDFQEDKPPLFLAMDEVSMCLRMAARSLVDLKTRPQVARRAAEGGYANATSFANYLVSRGVPFREAHEQTGRAVRRAIEQGVALEALSLADLQRLAPAVDGGVYDVIRLDRVIASCDVPGGTNPDRVRDALAAARVRMK